MRKKKEFSTSLLVGFGSLALSLVLFFHISHLVEKEHEVEIDLVVSASMLFPELCDVLAEEEVFLLDGRFPLQVLDCTRSPSLLRFYDGEKECEFTIPSKKYSDCEITLRARAREHPFGYALKGVRTVNVGMGATLFGKECKLYGKISSISVRNVG